jgi:hypothetical protein
MDIYYSSLGRNRYYFEKLDGFCSEWRLLESYERDTEDPGSVSHGVIKISVLKTFKLLNN